ncbi:MAG: hypothetical protein LBT04_04735 [Prevotellaceae bacterium]|nr:hypothetical protein [Prevotellaceae bacterium]
MHTIFWLILRVFRHFNSNLDQKLKTIKISITLDLPLFLCLFRRIRWQNIFSGFKDCSQKTQAFFNPNITDFLTVYTKTLVDLAPYNTTK